MEDFLSQSWLPCDCIFRDISTVVHRIAWQCCVQLIGSCPLWESRTTIELRSTIPCQVVTLLIYDIQRQQSQ